MLNKFKRRLTLLFSLFTCTVLTLIIIFILITTEKQIESQNIEYFKGNLDTIVSKLQTENITSQKWLAKTEAYNNLIIHVEDNGKPLSYQGSWEAPISRQELISKVKTLALSEEINTESYPISFEIKKSSVFDLNINSDEKFYGSAVIIPTNNGWRTLTILQYLPSKEHSIFKRYLFFVFINLLGDLAFILVCWNIIGMALKPVEKSQKKQTEFISAVSHELRSPLTVIQASASASLIDSSRSSDFILNLSNECNRMSRLIDDMLILTSFESICWSIKRESIDIDTLLIETYELFYPVCCDKGQALFLDLPKEPLIKLMGDKQRLQQILCVLMDNAVSYSHTKEDIFLRAYQEKHYLCIEVEDHGIGIPDDQKELIFDSFYRIDKSRNDKSHFGLGLSIAKELVSLHNGTISVKNSEGNGSTFIIKLKIDM